MGLATSLSCRTSGDPYLVHTIAFIWASILTKKGDVSAARFVRIRSSLPE
jgi:hypothetical protein